MMNSNIEIRRYTYTNRPKRYETYILSMLSTFEDDAESAIKNADEIFLAFTKDGEGDGCIYSSDPVGMLLIKYNPNVKTAMLHHAYVPIQHRGNGIGKMLVGMAIAVTRDEGYTHCSAIIDPTNEAAKCLFNNFYFKSSTHIGNGEIIYRRDNSVDKK